MRKYALLGAVIVLATTATTAAFFGNHKKAPETSLSAPALLMHTAPRDLPLIQADAF